jgi:hypothetical protein
MGKYKMGTYKSKDCFNWSPIVIKKKKPNSINILLAVEQDSLHCKFLQCNNIPNKEK